MGDQQVSLNLTPIPDLPNYLVDESGRIFSIKRGSPRLLSHGKHYGRGTKPYLRVKTAGATRLAHRLVASVFVGRQLYPHEFVNHKKADTMDNRPSNLEIVTHAQNVEHAIINKLYCSGAAWREARGLG